MPVETLRLEFRRLGIRFCFLNLAAYLISVIVLGVTLRFALGLLLGTAVLIISLHLLRISVLRISKDARRSGVTDSRRFLLFYAFRLAVFGIAFSLSLLFPQRLHPVGVAVPMAYPRLIYTADALWAHLSDSKRGSLHYSDSASDGKRGDT